MSRAFEIGLLVLGGGSLLLARFGLPESVVNWVTPEEPQGFMSSTSPWSQDYEPQDSGSAISFPNCDAARAAGFAPMRRGERGYHPRLDRDRDGVACEPYGRR